MWKKINEKRTERKEGVRRSLLTGGMKFAVSAACAAMLLGGPVNVSAAEGISAVFRGSYVDDGEWINDNRVSVGLDSPVIAMLAPSQILSTGASVSFAWDTATDEQKLTYLTSEDKPDNDALTWWVNSPFEHSLHMVNVVEKGSEKYYIAAADLPACLANGSIRESVSYYTLGDDVQREFSHYYLNVSPLDTGCMLWSLD